MNSEVESEPLFYLTTLASAQRFAMLSDARSEKLVIKSREDVDEASLDPRINDSSRPTERHLDEGITRQISQLSHHPHKEPISDEVSDSIPEPLYVNCSLDLLQ